MRRILIALYIITVHILSSHADEGMWTLHNLPDAIYQQMKSEGFQLPKSMLYDDTLALKNSVVNFSGYCTAEVVSPQGLVFTNHHCGFEAIRSHSTVEHDYLLNGFYAKTQEEELPCEDLFVAFMRSQRDITPLMDSLGIRFMSKIEQEAVIDSLNEALTAEARSTDSTYYVEVKPFYEGNAYYATTYQRYDDVRLVFAPTKSMGKFGGETDNWMWPRQTCDFSVFRIYVNPENGGPAEYDKNNVPMQPKTWLQVSTEGYEEGDFAMVLGYPGATERYLSSYGIREMRNCVNDPMQQVRGVKQQVMKRHMDRSEEVRIKYDSKFAQSANYWKNAIGMNKCIDSIGIVRMKEEYEQRITQWLRDSAALIAHEPDSLHLLSLPLLQQLYARRAEAKRTYTLFAESFTRRSHTAIATRAMKYADGMVVHGPENKPRKQYVQFADDMSEWDRDLDIDVFATLINNYRQQAPAKYLPAFYQRIEEQYAGDVKAYVNDIWNNSVLMKQDARIPMRLSKKLQKDTGIMLSMDLMEVRSDLKLILDELSDSIRQQERLLCAAKLRMEQELPHYSDANFTMRLTYGQVGGYTINGYDSGYYTTPQSLLDKMRRAKDIEDYFAEPELITLFEQASSCTSPDTTTACALLCSALDSTASCTAVPVSGASASGLRLCFLTNNDITGGNSGSPVLDARGRLIGLAFDGNWDSLSADIFYDRTLARCINVDIRYILYIMQHWGQAHRLLEELRLPKQ